MQARFPADFAAGNFCLYIISTGTGRYRSKTSTAAHWNVREVRDRSIEYGRAGRASKREGFGTFTPAIDLYFRNGKSGPSWLPSRVWHSKQKRREFECNLAPGQESSWSAVGIFIWSILLSNYSC